MATRTNIPMLNGRRIDMYVQLRAIVKYFRSVTRIHCLCLSICVNAALVFSENHKNFLFININIWEKK